MNKIKGTLEYLISSRTMALSATAYLFQKTILIGFNAEAKKEKKNRFRQTVNDWIFRIGEEAESLL